MPLALRPFSLDRVEAAVDRVRDRLARVSHALERAAIPYAIVGGNAVAIWVARVDDGAVRNTRDVDVMIRREDFAAVRKALERQGFVYRHAAGADMFVDGASASARDGVHVVFAGEKVRATEPAPNPDIAMSVDADGVRVLSLEALVRIKLTAYRDKDRTHLRDLIEVGLVDVGWCDRLPAELAVRLRHLLDTPEG